VQVSNVTLTGGGASTYTWTSGVNNGVAFAPTSTNTYSVNGTDANGCTNTAAVSVTVNNLPTVTANSTSSAVCAGSNVTLTGGGASTYTWTSGVNNGVAFAPTSTNTYSVNGTDANGCANTAVVSVTVNNLPTVTANSTSSAVCAGSNVTLTGGGASTYTWTSGVNNGVAFAPISTNTYSVNGTDANGCANTAVVSVTVNNLPTVTANSTSTVVCAGSNITLTGGGASTYSWTSGVNNGVAFAPASTNTYSVNGTDANGCTNTAAVSVTVNNLPTVTANSSNTLVCVGDNIILTGGGASTYTWTGGVNNGIGFAATASDIYTVTGADANGCESTASVSITVNVCTGLQALVNSNSISVFPNPNNGEFTIQSQMADVVSLTNELGQLIEMVELNQQNNFSYKVSQLSNGIYFLVGKTIKQKVVVTK
jgi:hypothetical protein